MTARRRGVLAAVSLSFAAALAFVAWANGVPAALGTRLGARELAPVASGAPDAPTGDVPVRAPAPAARGLLGAPVGSRFRHRVTDRCDFEVASDEAGTQPAGTLHVACLVTTTVLDRRAGEILVGQHFAELRFFAADGSEITGDPVQAVFLRAVAEPAFVRLDDRGAPHGFAFAAGLDGDQRNFVRGLLAVLRFQAPVEGELAWSTGEADTTGEYEAKYERLPDVAGEVAVRRTRERYTTFAGHAEPPAHELRGSGEARFSRERGWLVAGRLDEGMTMTMPLLDLRLVTTRRAAAELVAAERGAVDADVAALWAAATAPVTGRLEQVGAFAAMSERRRHQELLRGVTLDEVLAELAARLGAATVDAEAVNAGFQQMKWLVTLDGDVAGAIGERVLARQLTGELAGIAVSSLAASGTPAAQAVLVRLRNDASVDAAVREVATIAALQLACPSSQLVGDLVRDAAAGGDAGRTAMLVLGALAARHPGALADGRSPVAVLLAMELEATARGDLATWVMAVGNACPPQTLAIARRHFDHADAAVRAAACVALRRVADPAAVTMLIERGLADGDSFVRREAMLELSRRPEGAAREALANLASSDPDEQLRRRAGELLRERA